MMYYIGVDIGGTNIAIGIIGEDYRIHGKTSFKTLAPRSAESSCDDIVLKINKILYEAHLSLSDIVGIGVGCPGIIKNGVVITASNLKFDNVHLADMLNERTGLPVSLCNDANAAALAECIAGCGKGHDSLVAITIGTGVGGGIVIHRRIVEGFNGAGGEIGHFILIPDGRQCSCGNKGCYETYCSATAIIKDTKEAMSEHPESKLWQVCDSLDKVNGKTVYSAAALGDEIANGIIDRFVDNLALGAIDLIILLQPEVLCFGGGMSKQGEDFISLLRDRIYANPLISATPCKTIITAAKLFNDAGIIGAAANIMEELK